MRKIGEVLRLQAQGLSQREIGQSVGAAKTTVREYLRRAAAGVVRWPLPEGLDESELEEKLFPPPMVAAGKSRELKSRRHVTLTLLWLEYRQSHPEGLGYSQFCWQDRRWQGAQDAVTRLEYRGRGDPLRADLRGGAGGERAAVRGGELEPGPGVVAPGARALLQRAGRCAGGGHPGQPAFGGDQGVLVRP